MHSRTEQHELQLDPAKLKSWGIALGVLVALLALVDSIGLRGDSVGGGTLSLKSDSPPLVFSVAQPGERHLIEIRTRRSVRGKSEGQRVAFRLVDPTGVTTLEESELLSHKTRFVAFEPIRAGSYELHANEVTLLGEGRGTARVSVRVNDRRTLSRWLGF